MATLTWDTPEGRQEHRLGAETRIGRAPHNEVCLNDPSVSGFHAHIVLQHGTWILEDAGSTNGTFVNGDQASRRELRDGDGVGIGNVELVFRALDDTAGPTILCGKGMAEPPPPAEAPELESAVGAATSLDELFHGATDYSEVGVVDSGRLSTLIQPMAGGDPHQLARRLRASYEITRAAAATLDPSDILDRVLTALFGIFEQAERAFIVLVDPHTGEASTAAVKRRVSRKAADLPISRTALEHAMERREALLCCDAAADERFAAAQSIMQLGIRSMMIAPLVFRDQVLGAVHVDSVTGVREFTQHDLELLSVAATEVAGCLANVRLHEKVVDSERLAAVGQTLAGLTHCIKNILQGIKGGAYILDRGLEKNQLERVRAGWDMVRRNNAFMEELVQDLLTYSKDREPAYAEADVNTLCAEICELCGERARAKSVALAFEPDPQLAAAELDPKGIRRCLLNLVMNAVDACEGRDGGVTVATHAPGDDGLLRIAVRDTGCGMSQETLAKLFTVFFSTKGSKGTGLGLPVTKKIIEEHGGRLDVKSIEGEGTTFAICLPPERTADTQEGEGHGGVGQEGADRG